MLRIRTAVVAALALALQAHAQDAGDLLIASPDTTSTIFSESVVFVIHRDADGTIGLLMNRPTTVRPGDIFPDLQNRSGLPPRLYFGGPVNPTRYLLLLRSPPQSLEQDSALIGDVYVTDNADTLQGEALNPADEGDVRMYAGYAQWAAGQLEAEIARGAWQIRPSTAAWVFHEDFAGLWDLVRENPTQATRASGLPGSLLRSGLR